MGRLAAVMFAVSGAATPTAFGQPSDTADARQSDVEEKPSGRRVPPEMEILDQRYTDGAEKEFVQKNQNPFNNALKSASLSDEDKRLLDLGAKYHVYRFTMKKYREEELPKKPDDKTAPAPKTTPAQPKDRLHDLRKKLLDNIKLSAPTRENKPLPAREYFMKQVTDRCAELLDNHFLVRLNAVLLLGGLNSTDGFPPPRSVEPTAYAGAYPVLLTVAKDEKQHEAVRIAAVRGLTRICKTNLNEPNDKRRIEIAVTLAPELAKKNTHPWFQMVLAECLGVTGVTYDPIVKTNPVVLQALAEAMVDKQRHWAVRTEAAKAIGRLPLDPALNMSPVAYEMVVLGVDMAKAYNANTKRENWNFYFFNLYLAFKAEKTDSKTSGAKPRKPGLLEALPSSKEVKDAYEQVVQLAAQVLGDSGKQIPADKMTNFTDWLKSHSPANYRITNTSDPINVKAEPPAADNPSSSVIPPPKSGKTDTVGGP